jgi:hypothetical protein
MPTPTTYHYLFMDTNIKAKVLDAAAVIVSGMVVEERVLVVTTPDILTADEKARLDVFLATRSYVPTANDAITLRDPRYEIQTVVAGRVTQVDWYETDTGGGVFSNLAKREVHAWQGSNLLSTTTTLWYTDGSAGPTWTDTYSTDGTKRIRRRT